MNLSSFSQTLSSSMSMIYSSQFTNHSPTVILPRFVLSPSSSCSTLFSLPIGRRTHHHHQTKRSFISHGDTLRVASHILRKAMKTKCLISTDYNGGLFSDILIFEETRKISKSLTWAGKLSCGSMAWLISAQMAQASQGIVVNPVFEIGEVFELGIQLSYLLLLLGLLGAGTFFVIRQVLVRRELDLSAKELQEQVRSGDASATELFELGAVMLRRKFYPAATKYLLQAIDKWDGDDQDLAQVYNALGVSYVRDEKLDKGIKQFENAVRIQPGYTTAWNNLGDAYEKKKELTAALKAFEEVLLFDPNNKLARPRRDALKERVKMYKGIPVKSKDR